MIYLAGSFDVIFSDKSRLILETAVQLIHNDMACIESGNSVMSYLAGIDVELVDVPPMNILYLRKVLSLDECSKGYAGFSGKLFERIAMNNLTITGMPLTMYPCQLRVS